MGQTAANETSRIELLNRDVTILLDEVRSLRDENDRLKEENKRLTDLIDNGEQEERDELAFFISSQRESMRLDLHKFGRLVGVSGTTVKRYERGVGRLDRMQDVAERIRILRRSRK